MTDQTLRGRFVWHELMTPDSAASRDFYTKVLGWSTQPYEHDPSYIMFAAASGPLGGSASSEGAPHWLPVIGADDIEATARHATELGGAVVKDIAPVGGGQFAVLTDPQGAAFGIYSHPDTPAEEAPAQRGEFSWHELATSDAPAAFEFYSALFGWRKVREHDMGPEGTYIIFGRNDLELGGMYRKPEAMEGPPAWLGYVRVKDVNVVADKVKKSGGTVINGPMPVPSGDWVAQCVDPQGAMFAVHTLKADLESAAPTAEPAQADSLAETTVLTDISPAEARLRNASRPKATKKKPAPAKKAPGKKTPAKKAPAKKGPAKKAAQKRAAAKSAGRKGVVKRAAKKSAKKSAKKLAKRAKASRRSAARSARKTASRRPQRRAGVKRKAASKRRR